jgi:hypothetical protein
VLIHGWRERKPPTLRRGKIWSGGDIRLYCWWQKRGEAEKPSIELIHGWRERGVKASVVAISVVAVMRRKKGFWRERGEEEKNKMSRGGWSPVVSRDQRTNPQTAIIYWLLEIENLEFANNKCGTVDVHCRWRRSGEVGENHGGDEVKSCFSWSGQNKLRDVACTWEGKVGWISLERAT